MPHDYALQDDENKYSQFEVEKKAHLMAGFIQRHNTEIEAEVLATKIMDSQADDLAHPMLHVDDGESIIFLSPDSAEPDFNLSPAAVAQRFAIAKRLLAAQS